LSIAPNLRYLTFSSFQPPQNVAALARLPRLTTIVFDSRAAVDDAILAELAKLPQLQTLAIDVPPTNQYNKPLTSAGFAALATSPSLTNIYVGGWKPESVAEYLPLARAALPNKSVQSSRKHVSPVPPHFFYVIPFVGIAAIIGIQLSSQFRSPMRLVTPGFTRDHALFALGLAVLASVGCATRLIVAGALPSAAITFATLIVTTMVAGTALTSLLTGTTFQLQGLARAIPALNVVLIGLFVVLYVPEWATYLFQSGDPRVLVALISATAASAILLVGLFRNIVYWAAGATSLPTRQERTGLNWGAMYRDNWQFAGSRRELQIDTLSNLRPKDMPWWRCVERWRLANSPLRVIRNTMYMSAFFVLFQFLVFRSSAINNADPRPIVVFGAQFVLIQMAMQVGVLWRARMLTLTLESTRPCSRRTLRYEWMAAFLIDLLPGVLLVTLLAAIGLNWRPPLEVAWQAVPRTVVMIVPAAVALAVAIAAIIALVERMWLAFACAMGMIFTAPLAVLCTIGLRAVISRQDVPSPRAFGQLFESQAWGAAILGAIVILIMARRFFTFEVGRRA
ncbi:MAG: hypothetical protein ABUL64_01065, partial [Singulisphaera sp.]